MGKTKDLSALERGMVVGAWHTGFRVPGTLVSGCQAHWFQGARHTGFRVPGTLVSGC